MRKYVIVTIIMGGCLLLADSLFVIGAYQVRHRSWFATAHDSLRLNTVKPSWLKNQDSIDAYLDEAALETLNVILPEAAPASGRRFGFYSNLWHALWESEDTMFNHTDVEGKVVVDSLASNYSACVCSLGVDQEGLMQTGTWKWQLKIYSYDWHASSVDYTAIFRLKIDTTSLDDTTRVCSLAIFEPGPDIVYNATVLTIGDFEQQNVYEVCSLTFSKDSVSHNLIWYNIWWYENVTLWSDYVEVKDEHIDNLTQGSYDLLLTTICDHYYGKPALGYYYLKDEPRFGHFAASSYLVDYLYQYYPATPGIQTLGGTDSIYFKFYADSVRPQILWVDYYPFFGEGYSGGRTPEDSGSLFQECLDILCTKLRDMRVVALERNKDFWYAPQAFGKYDTMTATSPDEGGNEGRWRLPTERELRCETWLGVTYGAKGILYWLYETYCTTEADTAEWMRGLWCYGDSAREPLFSEACSINATLEKIGPTLVTLESDAVFKSTDSPYPSCFIVDVSSDDTVQIGTFFNTNNDSFFIMVNRLCQSTDNDTVVVKIHKDSLFLTDLYTGEAIPPDSEPSDSSYFSIILAPGGGKCFQLVPFAQDFKINDNQAYTNIAYVALNTKAWAYAGVDSMKIWQNYNDSLVDSTGWIQYDTAYCRQLRQGEGTNTMYIQYKIDGNINSPEYSDAVMYDETAPTYSFVINDDNTFTNTSDVTLESSLTDATIGPSKMRYGNKELKNPVKNSSFDNADDWSYDHATYDDTLKLYEIPVQIAGNYFFQAIRPESLEAFEEDTMLLWIDLVSDDFNGTGRVEFQYIYADTAVRHVHPVGCTISIPEGTNAKVSEYNLYSFFEFRPDSDSVFTEARVGIYIDSDLGNNGTLYIDNFRLDLAGPADDYTRFENYDSLKEWSLITGNGVRKVWGQFADCVGNETAVSFDSIIVDTTKPARGIAYPQNGQTISDTIAITGYAHDSLDHPQHFKQYELQYQGQMSAYWYGIEPESLFTTPVYPSIILPDILGLWNTSTVNDGWYNLKLTVADLASNSNDTTISVRVNNNGPGDLGGFSGFSNYLYGLAAGNDVYIGEFSTGKIYQYNTNYELIDTFKLVDSVGTGFPLAMAIDDSGKLWVANTNSHLISKFTPQGSLLLRFAGGFSLPSGFAFDNSGHIWVSDRLHHKIKKFNQDGDSLFVFGTQGTDPGEIK